MTINTTSTDLEEHAVSATAGVSPAAHTRARTVLLGLAASVLAALTVVLAAPAVRDVLLIFIPTPLPPIQVSGDPADYARQAERRAADLQRRLDARVPRRPYLVVSSSDNTFQLMQGADVLRSGLCSTGSYVQLKAEGVREWLFETPCGRRTVQGKRTNPVWTKPDWAFVEAEQAIPPPGNALRVERGVLGDYALSLGDGYLIHGTLYQRLLGQPVTHGCIRLGDADLEAVYFALLVGSPVYIY